MVVTRVNTVTGVRYSEDPTVLAWEVRWCVYMLALGVPLT